MTQPMLQIALDQTSLSTALTIANQVAECVEIIEAGTILTCAEGMLAVKMLRRHYPKHILVCDLKITDGGEILSNMAFEAGANWVTVSAAAHLATIRACKQVADRFNGEIQIELYGNWTITDAQSWVNLGIRQAIYHRSRDAELAGVSWSDYDLEKMKQLSTLGLSLSITGGISPETICLFEGIDVKSFIAGRALADQQGKVTAIALRQQIERFWP